MLIFVWNTIFWIYNKFPITKVGTLDRISHSINIFRRCISYANMISRIFTISFPFLNFFSTKFNLTQTIRQWETTLQSRHFFVHDSNDYQSDFGKIPLTVSQKVKIFSKQKWKGKEKFSKKSIQNIVKLWEKSSKSWIGWQWTPTCKY